MQEFKNRFAKMVDPFIQSRVCSLEESGTKSPENKLITEMLKWAFGFSDTTIKKMVWGKNFRYKYQNKRYSYRSGGISSFYSGAAVHTVYESILFFLQTGWWPMGLDKAFVEVDGELKTFTEKSEGAYSRNYKCFYSTGENFVVAATDGYESDCPEPNWFYTAILIRPEYIESFLKQFNNKMVFNGLKLDFEGAEFIGSGYSAVDLSRVVCDMESNK